MHYSRIMPQEDTGRYFTSTAVLLNEIIKFTICTIVAWNDRRKNESIQPLSYTFNALYAEVFGSDSWKLAIPAALYTLQNSLQYLAVSNLDAATFQVTYQLKILTTALFSVTMLRRTLSPKKWLSLVLLTLGIAIVQLPGGSSPEHKVAKRSATYEGIHLDNEEPEMNRSLGLTAVVIACVLSGLAGVYFEKVLKGSSATLWVRNIQLSFYSLFPAFFIGVLWKDGAQIQEKGFFNGYNSVVWTAIGFQAIGGIVVAMCVKYADNIAKNFATSISILLSFLASVYFFDFQVTLNYVLGASVVIFATLLYSKPDTPTETDKTQYVPLEKTSVGESGSIASSSAEGLEVPHQSDQWARPRSPGLQYEPSKRMD
ncbi:nucleotide-sugar transporter [Ascobolus immersus RN42]|uniref:Nucleotide-sugar transporter n=1 Tax=Ascobolus immersus RN42 TaxID=1160509 RepID=A0A3N4HZ55_ASCIM|nr:nucleotide-sugar transporter [Ascobolus immersus RN42]